MDIRKEIRASYFRYSDDLREARSEAIVAILIEHVERQDKCIGILTKEILDLKNKNYVDSEMRIG